MTTFCKDCMWFHDYTVAAQDMLGAIYNSCEAPQLADLVTGRQRAEHASTMREAEISPNHPRCGRNASWFVPLVPAEQPEGVLLEDYRAFATYRLTQAAAVEKSKARFLKEHYDLSEEDVSKPGWKRFFERL